MLALSDVSEAGLQETLKLVRQAGGDGFTQRCDVRVYSQLTAFAQACEEKLVFDVFVKDYAVHRVMRQFGLRQVVPVPVGTRVPDSDHA